MSIHHPSLSKTYSTISWRAEEIGRKAWCTWLSIPTIPSSDIFPNWAFPDAHVCISEFPFGPLDLLRSSAHSVSPHLVQSPTMPLEVSGFVSFSEDVSPSISRTKWEERACYFWFTHPRGAHWAPNKGKHNFCHENLFIKISLFYFSEDFDQLLATFFNQGQWLKMHYCPNSAKFSVFLWPTPKNFNYTL